MSETAYPTMTPEQRETLFGDPSDAVEDFIQRVRADRARREAFHVRTTGKARRPATKTEMTTAAETAVKRHQYGIIVDPKALLYILKSS